MWRRGKHVRRRSEDPASVRGSFMFVAILASRRVAASVPPWISSTLWSPASILWTSVSRHWKVIHPRAPARVPVRLRALPESQSLSIAHRFPDIHAQPDTFTDSFAGPWRSSRS